MRVSRDVMLSRKKSEINESPVQQKDVDIESEEYGFNNQIFSIYADITQSNDTKLSRTQNGNLRYYAYFFFNGLYTLSVSALFAGFSARRGDSTLETLSYVIASFLFNAPMAWFFTDRILNIFKRAYYEKEIIFRISFFSGLFFSVLTTIAGIQVAIESVDGLKMSGWISFLRYPLIVFSVFNTLSTRHVSSVGLFYALYISSRKFYYRRYSENKKLYLLQDDLIRFGDQVDFQLIQNDEELDDVFLARYMKEFYQEIKDRGLQVKQTIFQKIWNYSFTVMTVCVGSVFILNMVPLWIYLTVKGARALSNHLSHSIPFVLLAAPSNEFFYINSCRQFFPTSVFLWTRMKSRLKEKLGIEHSDHSTRKAQIIIAAFHLIMVGSWGFVAYLSGGGYGEDGAEAAPRNLNHFGSMANALWFSWMGWWTNLFLPIYSTLAQFSAGLVVNGGASLNFALAYVNPNLECIQHIYRPADIVDMLQRDIERTPCDRKLAVENLIRQRSSFWGQFSNSAGDQQPLDLGDTECYQTLNIDVNEKCKELTSA